MLVPNSPESCHTWPWLPHSKGHWFLHSSAIIPSCGYLPLSDCSLMQPLSFVVNEGPPAPLPSSPFFPSTGPSSYHFSPPTPTTHEQHFSAFSSIVFDPLYHCFLLCLSSNPLQTLINSPVSALYTGTYPSRWGQMKAVSFELWLWLWFTTLKPSCLPSSKASLIFY